VHGLDDQAFMALYGGPHGPLGATMIVFTLLGGGWAALGLIPLIAWPGPSSVRSFARALAVAIAGQALLVVGIKAAVGRVRPWMALGLPAPIGEPHDGSFPSGHAAGAFCVATFLAVAMPALLPGSPRQARLLSVFGMMVAAAIALSRVYLGAHFPSDVVAGGLLGGAIGAVAGRRYRTSTPTPTRSLA
jgi:undecaprenyl-diphosphatase